MRQKTRSSITCFLLMICILPLVGSIPVKPAIQMKTDGPHLDFLVGPELVGWGVTIWNFGSDPAFFIHWKISTRGVNGTRVLGGDRSGIILCLRPMRSQYMTRLTLPQTKIVQPLGRGEIEITVKLTCRNAGYETSLTSRWIVTGSKVSPVHHLF
ncbi:MAG: hypothetical protein V1726_06920 [Methanobacteriota archaeon]